MVMLSSFISLLGLSGAGGVAVGSAGVCPGGAAGRFGGSHCRRAAVRVRLASAVVVVAAWAALLAATPSGAAVGNTAKEAGAASVNASAADAAPAMPLTARYRQPVERWPMFQVDDGVAAVELGLLPSLPRPPWQTRATEALGRLLFFDPRLSGSGQIACATCHDSELGWGDGRGVPFGHDRTAGSRNAMTLLNAARFQRWSWDGRSASLQAQVLRAVVSPAEMNAAPASVAARLARLPEYAQRFADAFGAPGITPERIATAVSAFVRTIESSASRFDFFLRGNYEVLTDQEIEGLHLFRTRARCMNCHHGPLFSDGSFHHTGLSYYGRRFEDLGRFQVTGRTADRGKFRTPSLRDLKFTGPWMHNGLFNNFRGILLMYNHGITANRRPKEGEPPLSPLIRPLGLTDSEIDALGAFLDTLSRRPRIVRQPALPGMARTARTQSVEPLGGTL